VCDTGLAEEAELQWKDDKQAALAPCTEIKHVFARTARDCPEVTFLALEVLPSPRRMCSAICRDCRPLELQQTDLCKYVTQVRLAWNLRLRSFCADSERCRGCMQRKHMTYCPWDNSQQRHLVTIATRHVGPVLRDIWLDHLQGALCSPGKPHQPRGKCKVTARGAQAEGEEAQALCEELDISVLPTVQFYKDGARLWEHRGVVQLQQDLGEGATQSHVDPRPKDLLH